MTHPSRPMVTSTRIDSVKQLPQVRLALDSRKVEHMKDSMAQGGLIYPIHMQALEDGTYVVVDGHYRLAAAEQLGWTEIPAFIQSGQQSEADVIGIQLATAQCRVELNPMEEARGYDGYLRKSRASAAHLAALVGRTESHISRTRALITMKDEVQALVAQGKLGPSIALDLDRIEIPVLYAELLHRAKLGNLTRNDLHTLRKPPRRAKGSAKAPHSARPTISLGNGCSLVLNGSLRTVSEIISILDSLTDRVRRAHATAHDDLSKFISLIRQAPTA